MREPKARVIADTLRKSILGGARDMSRPLPSVAALMKRFGVARATASSALKLLEREGLVVSRPGSGTFVRFPVDRIPPEYEDSISRHPAAIFQCR